MSFIVYSVDKKKKHDPSAYRALVREAKVANYKQLEAFIDAARQLDEPYYRAIALFTLSANPKLDLKKAVTVAEDALGTVVKVDQLWRRAELLGILAKKLNTWQNESAIIERDKFRDKILAAILSMPNGKGLSDAIKHCTPKLGCKHFQKLFNKAILNKGFETEGVKVVIRQWIKQCDSDKQILNEILDSILKIEEPKQRSRLLGYLFIQCKKSNISHDPIDILHAAVESACTTKKNERLDALQYIAKWISTEKELDKVADALDSLEDQEERIRLIGTLGGSADKAGLGKFAVTWFLEGIAQSKQLSEPEQRANSMYKMVSGLIRCGETKLAKKTVKEALDNFGDNEKLKERIRNKLKNLEVAPSQPELEGDHGIHIKSKIEKPEKKYTQSTNHILALFDTYEGALKPVHFRAIARSAPLCFAFGLDLALIGFPSNDLNKLVNLVVTETNIGLGGKYLKALVAQSRVSLVPATQNVPPTNWDELGMPVATTSAPKLDKKVDIKVALRLAKTQHKLQRVCIIMGLGRSGLPLSLLNQVQYHIELTGSDVPLETCTAMGVIAQQLRAAAEVE